MAAAALPIVGLPAAAPEAPVIFEGCTFTWTAPITMRLLGALARVALPAVWTIEGINNAEVSDVQLIDDRRRAEAMYVEFCNAAGVPDHHRQWIDELYAEVMSPTPGAVVVG